MNGDQVLELDFGGMKSPWVMSNKRSYTQEDGYNCRPIACAKIMEIYGWIAPGFLPQIGKTPGGFRSVVMEFFSALLKTYDDDLRV
jgi:hypothetical protein